MKKMRETRLRMRAPKGSTLPTCCTTTKKKARECTSCSQLPVKRPH